MGWKRLTSLAVCLIGIFTVTCASAYAGIPRWFVKETGTVVSLSEESGLMELQAPETLQSQGALAVWTHRSPPRHLPVSNCLVKDRESIEDPSNPLSPGTGQMQEFEVVCEKGTGTLNAGDPVPCVYGEGFELKGVGLDWPSTLEASGVSPSTQYFDNFTSVEIEVECLNTKQHSKYVGSLRPQVKLGRLEFLGSASGELEDPSNHERIYFKGSDFIEPAQYKDVRAKNKSSTGASATANDASVTDTKVASWHDASAAGGSGSDLVGFPSSLSWGSLDALADGPWASGVQFNALPVSPLAWLPEAS